MDYAAIRRIVEEEVLKHASRGPSNARVRRPVVAEGMVFAVWRRGARELAVTPGALVTPAARERATRLGVSIVETMTPSHPGAETERLVEAVMAAVAAQLAGRSRPAPAISALPRFVTAADVERARLRHPEIRIGERTRITPLARDLAEKHGVVFRGPDGKRR